MSLLYAMHQQYKLLLYICTRSEVRRLCMSPQKGQLFKRLPHCPPLRSWGWSWSCLTVRHACCGLDMPLLCMQCLWRSVCVGNAHTPHTHQRYNGYFFHPMICLWYFMSHDMHVTPSSLQVTLPSAVEAGLSKYTTLQKLTVWGSDPSVTAALLKAVTVNRSLEEVSLVCCDFGM